MNKAIANLLNRVLRDWVEDLNPEQLNLSIFSGRILLKNLKLKSDFLDILGLPFKLESGTVGQIEVKIPWKNWYSSPLDVKVSDLSVLLKPVQVKDWNVEKEIEAVIKRKKFLLEHFELMNPDDFDMNVEVGNGIFGSKLLGNLQISLENVYFRYEDTFYSSEDFTLGGFIQRIEFFNCNNFWEKNNINGDVLYKLLIIKNASFFVDYREGIVICQDWYEGNVHETLAQLLQEEKELLIGHRYFLHPTSVRVELTINKDPYLIIPPFSVNAQGDIIKLEANIEQVEFIFSIKKFITQHFLFKKNVEDDIPERNFENNEIQDYRKLYMDYRIFCKSAESYIEEKEKIKKKLTEFEKGIFLNEIKIQRKVVLDELKVKKFENEKKIELKQISNSTNQNKLSKNIFKFIINKPDSEDDLDDLSRLKTMEMDLARLESRDSSMIRQITRTRSENLRFLKDSTQFLLNFSFNSIQVSLFDDHNEYVLSMVKEIKIEVIIRLASIKFDLKIGKLWVKNTFNRNRDLFSGVFQMEFDDLDKKSLKVCGKDWEMAFDYVYFSEFVKVVQKLFILNQKTEESLNSISESSLMTEEREEFFNVFKDILENGIIISYFLQADIKDFSFYLPVDPKNTDLGFFLCKVAGFNIKTDTKLKGLMTYEVYDTEIINFTVSKILKSIEKRILEPLNLGFQLSICKTRQFHKTGYKMKLFTDQVKVNLEIIDLNCINEIIKNNEKEQIEYLDDSEKSEKILNPPFFQDLGDVMKTKILISINSFRIQLDYSDNQLTFSLNTLTNITNLTKTKLLLSNISIDEITFTNIQSFQQLSSNIITKFKANLNADLSNLISENSLIIENMRINISPLFILVLINYYEELKKFIPKENLNSGQSKSSSQFSLSLKNCSILIKSHESSSWDILNLSFSTSFFYTSLKKNPLNKEISAQISHFQVINSKSGIEQVINKPVRISFSYESKPEISYLVKFEDLSLVLGFRDIDFFNIIRRTYSKFFYDLSYNQVKTVENKLVQQIIIDSLHIQFIDDTVLIPYPLIFFKGTSLVILSNAESLIVSGTFSCESFDNQLKIRQPFMRPWKFFTKSQNNEIIIVSDDELDFNLNTKIVGNLGIINKKLYQTVNDWEEMYSTKQESTENLDYEIINKLGVDCIFWFSAQPNNKYHLKNKEKQIIKYPEIEQKHRSGVHRKMMSTPQMHIINLSINKCSTVYDIQIQSNTNQIFKISGKYGIQSIRKSIKITEKYKIIKLTSNTCIFNKTQKPLNILYKGKVFHINKKLFISVVWKIENIQIQGLEPVKIEDKIFVEIKKQEFYGCYKERLEYKECCIENAFVVDAPHCFENSLPFDIVILIEDRDKLMINAGENCFFFGIGLINCILGIQILLKDSVLYTNTFSLEHGDQRVKIVNELNWYIKVSMRADKCVNAKILIMSDFLVINNCVHDIVIKKFLVPKNCIGFMEAPESGKVKINLASVKNIEKSDKINLNTVGLTECVTLTPPDASPIFLALHLSQFSTHTKILRILPRFIIKNELNIIIYIRQYNIKDSKCIKLFPGEIIHYSLLLKNSLATVQVSGNLIDWSSGFYICNLDDFQIKFKLDTSQVDPNSKSLPWNFPNPSNNFHFYSRVTVYSQNQAGINILIKTPVDPDFKIVNNTQFDLKIRQFKIKSSYEILPRGQSVVWVFENYLKNSRRVQIKLGKHKENFCIEEVIEKNRKIGPFLVKRYGCGNTRFLEVYEETSGTNKGFSLLSSNPEFQKVYLIDLKSLYISLFTDSVQEKLGILFTGLNCKYKIISEENEYHKIFISKVNFILSNMQIDNMDYNIEDFPVIIKREENDPSTPFFQLRYKREYFLLPNQPPVDVFHSFEMQVQPFYLKINHEFFLTTFDILHQIMQSFYYSSKRKTEESDLKTEYSMPEPPMDNEKSYFKFIRIHACNLKLSFRKQQSSQVLKNSSEFLKFLSNKFLDLALVTESPLSLKEVIIENSFQDRYSLFWGILQNYSNQCLFQFYRILGATEILGNPIGLVDKLGTGVFEFFSEPAKGLLKGPKSFIKGLSKGTKSLLGNIVSGGFGSVAGIAGSLYNIISEEHSGKNPLFNDLGLYDLKNGIKGISKPYKSYQNNGFKGLIPGVFKGIWGFSIAPVAAILHLSHTITHRLALEANDISPKDPDLRAKKGKFVGYDRKINWDLENFEGFFNYFFKDIRGQKVKFVVKLGYETIVVCEKMMFVVVGMEVIKKIKLQRIERVEVHLVNDHFLLFIGMGGRGFSIEFKEIAPLAKLYYALNGWC